MFNLIFLIINDHNYYMPLFHVPLIYLNLNTIETERVYLAFSSFFIYFVYLFVFLFIFLDDVTSF